jgi:DNA-binding response OmpR family regulator
MNSKTQNVDRIAIVDPAIDDYELLLAELESRAASVRVFVSGEEALLAVGKHPASLWIINARLPDMPGVELWELIRHRFPHASAFLVSNSYSVEDEVGARLAGATAYLCKPASVAWLDAPLPRCRSPAIRASPRVAR